ncbi:MAG: hypothetical protein CXT67_08510 [Methanobacteriota archaeon]|jgi:hypothetical protein|nr:MAG: hypothetical protein CXT67_08510 [Euryarchaeota archaeon]HIG20298.1 hypothetical protein [Candidatus Poseidoniales archaeon]
MANDDSDLGGSLMTIGFLVGMAPIWAESTSTLWPLFIVGPIIFVIGLIIKVSKSGDTIGRTFAVGINQHLPTSKGVDFLEKIVNIADNPNTSTMAVGKQPAGTHPSMGGILSTEFSFQSESYASSSNRGEFQRDSYDQYGQHEHERVLPLTDRDPVSTWYNPEDEWQNPVRYW